MSSPRATYYATPVLRATALMDTLQLHEDIKKALPLDPISASHMLNSGSPRWETSPEGFLLLDKCIYDPDINNLRLRVLQHKHDHITSRHLGRSKTIELV